MHQAVGPCTHRHSLLLFINLRALLHQSNHNNRTTNCDTPENVLTTQVQDVVSGNCPCYITAGWWHKLIEHLSQPFTPRQQHQNPHDHSSWLLPIYQHIPIASRRFAHL